MGKNEDKLKKALKQEAIDKAPPEPKALAWQKLADILDRTKDDDDN